MHLPDECKGGVIAQRGGRSAILLDSRLSRTQRRCVLAHELVHDERGTNCHADGAPVTWDAVVAREERIVHDIAVERLVPLDRLRDYCRGITDFIAVEPWEVAEVFDVVDEYAERALFLLSASNGGSP